MATLDNRVPNPHEPTKPFTIVNLTSVPKLTPITCLLWFTQVESLLFGFDLLKYVDGSHPCPPPMIVSPTTDTTKDHNDAPNPAYLTWIRQDKLLLGALLGTLSPTVASLVVHASTSYDVWTILATTYANPSRGYILQIKDRLSSITTENSTISEYMNQIKECTDKLSLMGKAMDHEDIISKVLNGLDYETYKPIIDSTRARDNPISFESLHEKLILHELTIKPPPNDTFLGFPASANIATNRSTNHQNNHPNNNTPLSRQGILPTPTINYSSTPFRGRCQYCHVSGHVISQCSEFTNLYPTIIFPPPPTSPTYRANHIQTTNPQANIGIFTPSTSTVWYLDNDPTEHLTNDLANLSLHTPSDGTDTLMFGDISTPIESIEHSNVQISPPRSA